MNVIAPVAGFTLHVPWPGSTNGSPGFDVPTSCTEVGTTCVDQLPGGQCGLRERVFSCKVKDGETVDDLYAFLTCPPNAEVAPIHPKAMPVILTRPQEWHAWLDGIPAAELQRPLPDGALTLVEAPV